MTERQAASANRYQTTSFVAPAVRRMPPEAITGPLRGDLALQAGLDVSGALQPIQGDTKEVTSAEDRARGYLLRMVAIGVVGLVVAGAAVLAFVLVAVRFGAQPTMLERFLVFLLALGALLLWAALRLNATDYEHSRGGIERLRLEVADDMHARTIAAELTLRRAALAASLHMLERGQDDRD